MTHVSDELEFLTSRMVVADNERAYEIIPCEENLHFEETAGGVSEIGDDLSKFHRSEDSDVDPPTCEYDEEDVMGGVTVTTLKAIELQLYYLSVESFDSIDDEQGTMANELNELIIKQGFKPPVYTMGVVEEMRRSYFTATVDFAGHVYSVGPATSKKELIHLFHRQYFSPNGKHSYLMSKFLLECTAYVASKRKETLIWDHKVMLTSLVAKRADYEETYISGFVGARAVARCCYLYLREKMGFEVVVDMILMPQYSMVTSIEMWRKEMGEFTASVKYDFLKTQCGTKHDPRERYGIAYVDGVDLSLVVQTRVDYHELVTMCYHEREEVCGWLRRRYGEMYARVVAILLFDKILVTDDKPNLILEAQTLPGLTGDKLVRGILGVIVGHKNGFRTSEILKELLRKWSVEPKELMVCLKENVDIVWSCLRQHGIDYYFPRKGRKMKEGRYVHPGSSDLTVRYGDDVDPWALRRQINLDELLTPDVPELVPDDVVGAVGGMRPWMRKRQL